MTRDRSLARLTHMPVVAWRWPAVMRTLYKAAAAAAAAADSEFGFSISLGRSAAKQKMKTRMNISNKRQPQGSTWLQVKLDTSKPLKTAIFRTYRPHPQCRRTSSTCMRTLQQQCSCEGGDLHRFMCLTRATTPRTQATPAHTCKRWGWGHYCVDRVQD